MMRFTASSSIVSLLKICIIANSFVSWIIRGFYAPSPTGAAAISEPDPRPRLRNDGFYNSRVHRVFSSQQFSGSYPEGAYTRARFKSRGCIDVSCPYLGRLLCAVGCLLCRAHRWLSVLAALSSSS